MAADKGFQCSDGRQECHPLFNKLVFENILPYLNVTDLRQSRLVCKAWNEFSTPRLREHAVVKIGVYDKTKFFQFLDYLTSQAVANIKANKTREEPTTTEIFYHNFEFSSTTFATNTIRLNEFVLRCAPTLRKLKLTHVVVRVEEFRKILLDSMPQLEELILSSAYFYRLHPAKPLLGIDRKINRKLKSFTYMNTDMDNEQKNVFPWNWIEFFTFFPKLTEFNAVDFNDEMGSAWLLEVQSAPKPLKIEKLSIFSQTCYSTQLIDETHWKLLIRLNLKLTSLVIDLAHFVNEREFHKLLQQQATTLVELRMWRGIIGESLQDGFPYKVQLPRLEILEVPGNIIADMTFVNYMRNLKNLWIRQCVIDPYADVTNMFTDVRSVRPVHTLKSFRIDALIDIPDLDNLHTIFPNMKNVQYCQQDDDSDHEQATHTTGTKVTSDCTWEKSCAFYGD